MRGVRWSKIEVSGTRGVVFMRRWFFAAIVALSLSLGTLVPRVQSQSLPDLFDRIRPSIAFVLARSAQGAVSGTGFLVHPDGLLLTAHHVVNLAREISVVLPGQRVQRAIVIGANPDIDIAVLQIPIHGIQPLTLGDSSRVRAGEEILVAGYPLASVLGTYEVTITRGIVNAVRTQAGLIQIDAPINPGMSGGPIVNLRGEVIGVAVLVLRGAQSVNFAVPINPAKPLIPRVLTPAQPTQPPPLASTPPQPQVSGVKSGSLVAQERETTRINGQVQYFLSINKQVYEPTEVVEIRLRIFNTGPDVTFTFLTAQLYDFVILQGTAEVARWSIGRQFVPLNSSVVLAMRATFEFRTQWRQQDQAENQVPPGNYTIVGYFLSWPSPMVLSLSLDKVP